MTTATVILPFACAATANYLFVISLGHRQDCIQRINA